MSRRILVADDSPTVVALVERALTAAGWDVVTASDGRAALDVGLGGGIDLAFLDYFMPGLLGSEVLAGWDRAGVSIPTIILSNLEDGDSVVGLLEAGAVDFVTKPFNVRELVARARIRLPAGDRIPGI